MRLKRTLDGPLLWIAAAAVLICGCWLVDDRYEQAIQSSNSRTQILYARTLANERTIREASSLRRIQRVAETDLHRIARNLSRSITTARLLLVLENSAAAHHAIIVGVEPQQTAAIPPFESSPLANGRLPHDDVIIRLQGKFADILRFVASLSRQPTLVGVGDTELALTQPADSAVNPTLDATIKATLYRLALPAGEERRIESAR